MPSCPSVCRAPLAHGRPEGKGGGAGGWAPALGVGACQGSTLGRWSTLPSRKPFRARPTGRRSLVCAFAHSPLAARVATAASCGAVGGGKGCARRSRVLGAAAWASGQWSVLSGSQGPLCRGVRVTHTVSARQPGRVPARVPVAFPVSRIGGYASAPPVLLRGRPGGGWRSGLGGPGVPRVAPQAVGPLPPPRAHCLGSEARLARSRAIVVGFGRHMRLCLRWG